MIADIRTVVWKERKSLFRQQGRRLQTLSALLIPVLFLGLVFPWQAGRDWATDPISLFTVIIPFALVGITIPDSFAGERERRTLSALLATRLPDRAILAGKLVIPVIYGWGCALLVLLLGLVVVNVFHGNGELLLYPPTIFVADLVLTLLVAILIAAMGALVSLRASTVQGAQQLTMMIMLAPALVLQIVTVLLFTAMPDGRLVMRQILTVADFSKPSVILVSAMALLLISGVLLAVTAARFHRARLITG